jgi:hypothetical protein
LLGSLVVVFQSDDVVLTEIITKLNLNQRESTIRTITKPVICLWWNVDVVALSQLQFTVAADDIRSSPDDDPMFATLSVALQAQPGAGQDFQQLNFEARLFLDYFVPTPGPFIRFAQRVFPFLVHSL